MLYAPWRSRWRRCVLRCFLTFSSLSRVRLIESPIIRRSSSIWVSPGPPRAPMPPRWRSRCDQRRTSRVLRYCRRASSTCSLPSWLRARCAKISRISSVRSLTARPRWRSRLRCWPGLSDWSNRISVAPSWVASALISSALPLPTNSAASGALRLAVMRPTGCIPAVRASSPSSSSSASKWGSPRSTPTRMAGAKSLSWESGNGNVREDQERETPGGEGTRAARPGSGRSGFAAFGRREVDGTAGNDGGDGVLVDHLGHGIAEQDDVLVERLDLALQLDAVDEVDRDRNMLATQRVQERVL